MTFPRKLLALIVGVILTINIFAAESVNSLPAIQKYQQSLVKKYHFSPKTLQHIFTKTYPDQKIIHRINHPYEQKPWVIYQKFFIKPMRIQQGVEFWQQHKKVLTQVEQKFGVPANVIVAIIGVETKYGRNIGGYSVMNTLTTLAFYQKPRAKFFKNELTQFLLLTREQHLNPLELTGSYAGALGIPQFMPSAYRHYALDYSNEGSADLLHVPNDAIISVANYLKKNGWKRGQPVADKLAITKTLQQKWISSNARPRLSKRKLRKIGITLPKANQQPSKAAIINLETRANQANNYWLTYANFKAIMRYNPRINYAMAVHQLSEAIKNANKQQSVTASTKPPSTRKLR